MAHNPSAHNPSAHSTVSNVDAVNRRTLLTIPV
jgi:hypothetical protein